MIYFYIRFKAKKGKMHLFAFLFACKSTISHRSKNSILGQKTLFLKPFFP